MKIFMRMSLCVGLLLVVWGTGRLIDSGHEYFLKRDKRTSMEKMERHIIAFCLSDKEFRNPVEIARTLMNCVHMHSIAEPDKAFYRNFHRGPDTFIKEKYLYINNISHSKPHMECSARSAVLMRLLKRLNYKAHYVTLVSNTESLGDHAVVGVEIDNIKFMLDPTWNVSFSDHNKSPLDVKGFIDLASTDALFFCKYGKECKRNIIISADSRASSGSIDAAALLPLYGFAIVNSNPKQFYQNKSIVSDEMKKSYCNLKPYNC